MAVNVSRRVSYILPTPEETPPLLSLPPLGERRRGVTQPYLTPKSDNPTNGSNGTPNGFASRNPFAATPPALPSPKPPKESHPRHCLGITSLALDTSTILSDSSAPGGILYTGGRDGLVASWDLGIPHKRRRGGRYEVLPGRGGRVKWERVGDGAEMWDEDDEDDVEGIGMSPMGGNEGFDPDDDEELWSEEEDVGDNWGGVDGERVAEGLRKRRAGRGEIPYEDRWEVDHEALRSSTIPPTTYRQSAQTHTDWVNAMLLCNLNQTIITASSDRTIRAWSPHASSPSSSPALIGRHRDYVRSLAWAKYPSLLFSGALDRQVAIWDVAQPNPDQPLLEIDLNKADDWGGVGMEGERGSVYALGVDPAGKVLAAGTPERVVRLWDPRVGDKTIGKLVGHSDCVRSVVISEDGRYMLTGSSDTTIKLWSLAAHRCLHTFNHHTSSVWSLHSNHPNLERFYSGSRDGHLCAVDVEQVTDISDGECVVLAREGAVPGRKGDYESKAGDEGIRCIVGMDDEFVWTATGSAEVKRWRDVGRRITRTSLTDDDDGTSYGRVGNGDFSVNVPGLDQPFAPTPITEGTLKNKRLSLDAEDTAMARSESKDSRNVAFAPPPNPRGESASPGGPHLSPNGPLGLSASTKDRLNPQPRRTTLSGASVAGSFMSDNSAYDNDNAAINAHSFTLHGVPYDSLVCLGLPDSPYSFGFGHAHRSGDIHEESVPRGLNNLLKPDGAETGGQRHGAQAAREHFEDREIASEAKPLRTSPDEIIKGRPGLVRSLILNDRQHVLSVDTEGEVAVWNIVRGVCVGRFSAAEVAAALALERGVKDADAIRKHSVEVLELVRDRVEGETMVITWCAVDTRIGSLVVHLEEGRVFDAEVYADELGIAGLAPSRDDVRLNLGKWALANLFKGLIKAEEREVISNSPTTTNSSLPSIPRSPEMKSLPIERGPSEHPHRKRALTGSFSGPTAPSLDIPGLATRATRSAIVPDMDTLSKSAPSAGISAWQSFQALRAGQLSSIAQSPGSQPTSAAPTSPMDSTARGDYFSVNKKKEQSPNRGDNNPTTPGATSVKDTPTGGSKLKLKFGKKKKTADQPMSPVVEYKEEVIEEDMGPKVPQREIDQLRILDTVRSHAFHPPGPTDAPPVQFPSNTSLLISEESKDAGAWVVTYRSQVGSTEADMIPLEINSPLWLLDYLFTSRTKVKDPVKLTFILEPVPGCGLKDMPEGSTRLSASRILRAKKIMAFIFDKLDLGARARGGSIASAHSRITALAKRGSIASNSNPPGNQVITENSPQNQSDLEGLPEDTIELLCGSHVVDPKMTLATLKQYYGSGGDMLLQYRPKKGVTLA